MGNTRRSTIRRALRNHGVFGAACLLALGALFAAYANHFDNAFHFDDSHVIVNNLAIRGLHDIPKFFTDANTFTSRPQNAVYRPLLTLSYAIDFRLAGGLEPRQFHRTQFALLILLGALLVPFFKRLGDLTERSSWNRYLALFAATLFCIHTANTETINYLSSRSSLAATLGVVVCFVLYLGWSRGRRSYLYTLPMLIGGLAKPLTVMFAPLLFVFSLFFEERCSVGDALRPANRRKVERVINRTFPVFVVGGLLYLLLSRMNADTLEYARIDRWKYLITQPFVWLHYFRLFILPRGLTADTDWKFLGDWRDVRLLVGLLFIAGLFCVTWWLSRSERMRPAAFGLAWFAIGLLPTSSIFPLSEVYNEHRIFFPYVGLALALTWIAGVALRGPARWRSGRGGVLSVTTATVLAVGVVAAHGVGTHERNKVWRDSESLWFDVTRKSPKNGRGLMNYGLALMKRGDYAGALGQFEQAHLYTPNYSILEINLGIVKNALRDPESAERHFRRALTLAPGYSQGHHYFARFLKDQARGPEAVTHLIEALELSPGNHEANLLLIDLYAAKGDDAALAERVRGTLAVAPADPVALSYSRGEIPFSVEEQTAEAYEALGMTKIGEKKWTDAAVIYRHALTLDPASATAWNNLGWARAKLGFYDRALPCFEKAIELDPSMDRARNNLEWAAKQAAAAAAQP